MKIPSLGDIFRSTSGKGAYRAQDAEVIANSGAFSQDYYRHQLPSHEKGAAGIAHYLRHGAKRHLNPHPLFSGEWYLKTYADVAASGADPFLHYIRSGWREGRMPGPLLEGWYYRGQFPDWDPNTNPLTHFLAVGMASDKSPTPLIDTTWYRAIYPDTAASPLSPTMHFLTWGVHEGRDPNPLFETAWYQAAYPDVVQEHRPPFWHFITYGATEGRSPGPMFDAPWYLSRYEDVARSGMNPLSHYLSNGQREGRAAYAPMPAGPVAVVAHIFYIDLLPQITQSLKCIPGRFDLYVTVPDKIANEVTRRIRRSYPEARVIVCGNAGFDVLPLLTALDAIFRSGKSYLAVCKIHTKKGSTEPDVWRHLMYEGVLGSPKLVSKILRIFATDPNVAMVGPRALYLSGWEFIGANGHDLVKLFKQLYPGRPIPEEWGFFAGTIFWFRPEPLRELVAVARDRFSLGVTGANDGETAHAVERIIGLTATAAGKQVALVHHEGFVRDGFAVDVVPAATHTVTEPPHIYLGRMAKQLRGKVRGPAGADLQPRRLWTAPSGGQPGLRIIAPLTFVNGLSVSAKGYLRAAEAADISVSAHPWSIGFDRLHPIEIDLPPDAEQPIQLVHLNLDLLYTVDVLDPIKLRTIWTPNCYNILVCYFELSSLKPEWLPILDRFDEVWCASSFIEKALNAASKIKTRIVRPNFPLATITSDEALGRSRFGLPEDRFVFAYLADAGSILDRKNPLALVRAYVDTFRERDGACCFIKVHYSKADHPDIVKIKEVAAGRLDVIFSTEIFTDVEMESLFRTIDCYVSPHRTEGLGLTIIESMKAGKPVIATDYGGSTDFVLPSTGYPLPYRLVEVGPGNEPYPADFIWADVDPKALAGAMRKVFGNRDAAARLGAAARHHVEELFSLERATTDLAAAIDDIWKAGQRPKTSRRRAAP